MDLSLTFQIRLIFVNLFEAELFKTCVNKLEYLINVWPLNFNMFHNSLSLDPAKETH